MAGAELPVAADRPRFSDREVARYYDRNTGRFLRHGQGGEAGLLHRAVWGPGVEDREAAFHFVHRLLETELRGLIGEGRTATVLDLGSGTGATLEYLLARHPVRAIGVTVSPVQHRLALERLGDRFGGRTELHCADFCRAPVRGGVDLVLAIESFTHAPDPADFFRQVESCLEAGGRLAICDDFRAAGPLSEKALASVRELERGWRLSSLLPAEEVDRLASGVGLELCLDLDLTPYLELDRPRDRALALLVPLLRPLVFARRERRREQLASLVGGDALRRATMAGGVEYRFRVWQRSVREKQDVES